MRLRRIISASVVQYLQLHGRGLAGNRGMLRKMLIALMAEFIGFGKHPPLQRGDLFGRLVCGREEVGSG
jgi:hypothetical protein